MSTERGYHLADFALFAFGGAGPLHAIDVAAECGIPVVVVPQEPGTMCARGMLLTHVSFDFVRSLIAVADERTWHEVGKLFATMRAEALAWLEREQVEEVDRSYRCHLDARYQGQNFEVIVPLPAAAGSAQADLDAFMEAFAAAHKREYGYDLPGKPVEISRFNFCFPNVRDCVSPIDSSAPI